MTSSNAVAGLVVGAVSIALFTAAAAVSTREFVSASDRISVMDWMGRLSRGDIALGLSTAAQHEDLNACYEMMGSVYGLTRPTQERHRNAQACSDLAMGIVAWSPSNAQAWLVAAAASAQLGQFDDFNARLLQSQVSGPYEQWVAEMRVETAEPQFDRLDAQTRANHLADLDMLVHSLSGIRSIAQRYLGDTDFQERIVRIVETMPEAEQRRFLETVKLVAFEPAV